MKHNQWCPIKYIAIHSEVNLNRINRNRKMEYMKKKLQVVTDTLVTCLKYFEFMKRMF